MEDWRFHDLRAVRRYIHDYLKLRIGRQWKKIAVITVIATRPTDTVKRLYPIPFEISRIWWHDPADEVCAGYTVPLPRLLRHMQR